MWVKVDRRLSVDILSVYIEGISRFDTGTTKYRRAYEKCLIYCY